MAAKKGKKKEKRVGRKPMKPIISTVHGVGYTPRPRAAMYKGHKGIIKVVQMDTSISSGADSRARAAMRDDFNKLKGKTHFEDFEVERLLHIYWKLTRNTKFSAKEFRFFLFNAFGMCNRYMIKLMYNCLEEKKLTDTKGEVPAQQFIKLMSIFCRGTLQEKMAFAFKVYDTSKTGMINESQILNLIQRTFINQGVFEQKILFQAREYQLYVLNEFDPKDLRRITFEDYKRAVTAKPGLLEGFGQLFPDRVAVYTFLTTFTPLITIVHAKFDLGADDEDEAVKTDVKRIHMRLRTLRSFTKMHVEDLYGELFEDEIVEEDEGEDEESSEEENKEEGGDKDQQAKMDKDRASLRKLSKV